jgi:hypothetical protein
VAAYDTARREALYVDSLDMRGADDRSFIGHELVHYPQHFARSGRHESCFEAIAAERQAYAVQNRYANAIGQMPHFVQVLRFLSCPADPAAHLGEIGAAGPALGTPLLARDELQAAMDKNIARRSKPV